MQRQRVVSRSSFDKYRSRIRATCLRISSEQRFPNSKEMHGKVHKTVWFGLCQRRRVKFGGQKSRKSATVVV
eukprot:223719-Pleurochrysis_carterae.AAC.1